MKLLLQEVVDLHGISPASTVDLIVQLSNVFLGGYPGGVDVVGVGVSRRSNLFPAIV